MSTVERGIDITPPPFFVVGSDGGGPEEWTCFCYFEGIIADSVTKELLKLPGPVGVIATPNNSDYVSFRVSGHMDEALADAVQTIKPIIGTLIKNSLREVHLMSRLDAFKQHYTRQPINGFDITRSVKAALGLT